MNVDQLFFSILAFTILQRISEIVIAKRNTVRLLEQGAVEFGASHYALIVIMHTAFFVSMITEYLMQPASLFFASMLIVFAVAQTGRVWVLSALGRRWTTRVLVIKGESLVAKGPYKFFAHPNYVVVALEILTLPLAFGLWYTALLFTILNALMLLVVRIPVERKALDWSQVRHFEESLNIN